jgi:hypothetical protein
MTERDVYIAKLSKLSDPLDWGGDWNYNMPPLYSNYFPPNTYPGPFSPLIEHFSSGRFEGKQVDRCAAPMSADASAYGLCQRIAGRW